MIKASAAIFFTLLLTISAYSQWVKQTVNTTASFRGLSVVNEKIIWASGTEGTVIRTIDGGKTWNVMTVPGAEKLDFRDIEAFDDKTAYVLSIGNGESSRIYKTTDGGTTWKLEFQNTDERAFFDAIACSSSESCVAMSDPVGGSFVLMSRSDEPTLRKIRNDAKWQLFGPDESPKAKEGEAAFAASGTCLIALGRDKLFLVTGGSEARVITKSLGRRLWETSKTFFVKGSPGSGIFSIAMYDLNKGVIVGGNYEKPDDAKDNLAFTTDGGETWKLGTGLTGYRSAVAYIDKKTIIAVGTNGTDITRNGGKTWKKIGNEDLNAVAAKGKRATWAVGPKGMVVKMK